MTIELEYRRDVILDNRKVGELVLNLGEVNFIQYCPIQLTALQLLQIADVMKDEQANLYKVK